MSINGLRYETGSLDDRMTCPYNTSHVMTGYKFQRHLIKCRKDNPEKAAKIKVCPYNQIHHIPMECFDKHLEICPQYLHFLRTVKIQHTATESSKEAERQGIAPFCAPRPISPPIPPTLEEKEEWQ